MSIHFNFVFFFGRKTKNIIMKGLNKVSLIGNLGRHPDHQVLKGNLAVAHFSLATTEIFRNKNGELKAHTEWHRVIAWASLADFSKKYLRCGSSVFLEGRLRTRTFISGTGEKKEVTEIIADSVIMLGKGKENSKKNALES